ncbi:MAG TPA: ABC transporter permease, partial [Dehalococcoidia bacterium]|nr:ABC transporter permease [Dehalococcoidia bacterium]
FYSVVSLWILSMIIFALVRSSGNPAELLYEYPGARQEDIDRQASAWGLDKPWPEQYGTFVWNIVRFDYGQSFQYGVDIRKLYFDRLPNSLQLAFFAFLVSVVVGIPLGIMSAVKVNTWWDSFGKLVALLGLSIPPFFVALVLVLVFGVKLGWFSFLGKGDSFWDWQHLTLPAISLGWFFSGALLRVTRSSMLEVLGSEYIKLARLKGLPEMTVIVKHAFKNAFIPVLTLAAVNLVVSINVAVVVEVVFSWPGIGRLLFDGLINRDFPLVQGVVLMAGIMIITTNFVVDVLYGYLDPRIRITR